MTNFGKRRKISKATFDLRNKEKIDLLCSKCQALVEGLDADTSSVICDRCIARMAMPPEEPKAKKVTSETDEKHPRGWHLKKHYVSPSGKVYCRGKEIIDDSKNIKVAVQSKE